MYLWAEPQQPNFWTPNFRAQPCIPADALSPARGWFHPSCSSPKRGTWESSKPRRVKTTFFHQTWLCIYQVDSQNRIGVKIVGIECSNPQNPLKIQHKSHKSQAMASSSSTSPVCHIARLKAKGHLTKRHSKTAPPKAPTFVLHQMLYSSYYSNAQDTL